MPAAAPASDAPRAPAASRYAIVQESMQQAMPKASRIGTTFYELLLAKHPAIGPLFAHTDFDKQAPMLMETIAWAVAHLDQPEVLTPRLAELGQRHHGYGARPEHYDLVGECLLGALERELGAAFTDALRQAWAEVYLLVAAVMQDGAASMQP